MCESLHFSSDLNLRLMELVKKISNTSTHKPYMSKKWHWQCTNLETGRIEDNKKGYVAWAEIWKTKKKKNMKICMDSEYKIREHFQSWKMPEQRC